MPLDPLQPGWTGLSPMAQPFLHALNRMQARATIRPDQLEAQAAALLEAHFGPGKPPATTFARGGVGLVCDHSHYFDGFALMLPLAQGTAVALRPAPQGRTSYVAFEEGGVQVFGSEKDDTAPLAVRVVTEVLGRLGENMPVQVAVVSSIPTCFQDARLSSLSVALAGVVAADAERHARLDTLAAALRAALYPFSLAYLIAALDGQPGTYTLVDARTYEFAALEAMPENMAAWGLVDPGTGRLSPARSLVLQRRAQRALLHLQRRGFESLASFRYLEHRDLAAALEAADARHRATIQYLVSENRRVVNIVRAIKQRDLQMMGAILLTSFHARSEWEGTHRAENATVAVVEEMALEGIYGATLTGHGRSMLVLGQPATLPTALDRMANTLAGLMPHPAQTMLL